MTASVRRILPFRAIVFVAALLILTGGCAIAPNPADREAVAEFAALNDPAEPTNRTVFAINRGIDAVILKPVATFYRDYIPKFFQDRVNDVLDNLRSPVIFVNDLLQGEIDRAIATLARFVVNSTWGLAGLNDIATAIGMEGHDEDFGQTLAVWGVPEGPYVMLPLFGPSNPRDTVGLVVDFLVDPFNVWAGNTNRDYAILSRTGARGVDQRAVHMEALDDIERTSLDYYASIRSLYRQRRAEEIRNGKPSATMPAPGLSQAPADGPAAASDQAARTQ
ncbi:MAG: VacJ family lipoprotein [Rhodospirillales bacterium]|nr:VacJ family lipoprotein [Rhodospirillales bacterium]